MANKKVLYISQEITPYLPESPLSALGRNAPQKMQELGYEVRTFMPKYGCINERRNQLHEVIRLSGMNIVIDDTDHPLIIKVATLQPSRMQVYFIDNEDYFHHSPSKELETESSPADNDERMMFFVRGVIETVKKLRWVPSVIHAIGWISALAPVYIKRLYPDDPTFSNAKVVYALGEESFNGTLDERFADKLRMLQLTDSDLRSISEGPVDAAALNKLAIDFADAIIVSSGNISAELLDYARSTGKPMLEFTPGDDNGEGHYENYAEFYNSLLD